MQIAEMRSSLEADYAKRAKFGDQFPAAPAWVVRHVYEKRNGLPLTPFPGGIEVRSVSSIMVAARPHVAAPALATESDREEIQRRIRATQLAFLS